MPYMELNGSPCCLPSQLLKQASELPHLDFSLSDWSGKANSFHHQRGSDPSYGYLLVTNSSITGPPTGLSITYQDGTTKTFLVKIESSKKVTPAYYAYQGYSLVKVVDERVSLADTLVEKRFNLLKSFTPSDSASSKGEFEYVKETMRKVSETLSVPYDWENLFKEIFKVPSNQTLETAGITFPTYTPQDLNWRYVTRRDALEMLLQWTGTSIVYQEGESNWKLVALDDPDGGNLSTLLTQYDSSLCKNRHQGFKDPGSPHPKNFKLYFRLFEVENDELEQFKIEEKPTKKEPKNGQDYSLRLPSYFVDDPSAPQPPTEVVEDWLGRTEKFLSFFPSQEKTFRGWIYNPKGTSSNAFPMIPSAFVERVSWFDIGDGPKTLCVSVTSRKWVPTPKEFTTQNKKTRIAVGKVYGNVTPGMTTFRVDYLRVVAGKLPKGIVEEQEIPNLIPPSTPETTAPHAFVRTRNTHNQAYQNDDTIMIFSEEGEEFWDTDRSGGTPAGLIRFELAAELDKEAFTVQGYLLDQAGNRVKVGSTTVDQKVLLGNAWQIHQGMGPRKDGLYGQKPGYKGYATLVASNPLGDLYQIVIMEAQARWVIGKTFNEVEADAVSFPAHVDKYWGAFPNDREPVTEIIEEGTSQDDPIYGIRVWDELDIIRGTVKADTKYLAVWDEENNKYILTNIGPGEAEKIERYALLVRDIPKATWTLDKCTHGYADAAAVIFSKQRDNPGDDTSPHFFKKTGDKKPVINPNWPEIIKAGETTNASKPVVARGYLDDWTFGDGQEQEVFVITSLVYPISWIKGISSGAVSGTGNITVTGVSLLWGRDPVVTTVSVANPEGWDGPPSSTVYAMQIKDGTWLAMYVSCPVG